MTDIIIEDIRASAIEIVRGDGNDDKAALIGVHITLAYQQGRLDELRKINEEDLEKLERLVGKEV